MKRHPRLVAMLAVAIPFTLAQAAWPQEAGASATDGEDREFRWIGRDGAPLPFADEEAVLDFLSSATVVERETLGTGITRPQRLVLEKGGVRARAIFHDVDIVKDREKLTSGEVVFFFRDSYRSNVAVYELSRLLGVPNVPPAVIRKLGPDQGSVQLWIEGAYSETERRQRPAEALSLEVRRRIRDMRVFDNLINNTDRNDGNMLYDSFGEFWLIDHTRTLSRSDQLPSPDEIKTCSRSLLAAIRELDEARIRERLTPFLSRFEIGAFFRRRGKLLELIDRKIADNGEENVLFSYD